MGRKNDVREKEARALELRAEGRNLDDIAAELGYADRSGASRAISRALEKTVNRKAEHYLALANAQLDALDDQAAAAHRTFGTNADSNLKAIEVRRRIIETRSRLLNPKGKAGESAASHGNDFGKPRGFMIAVCGDGFEKLIPWDDMVINASPGESALSPEVAPVVRIVPSILPDAIVRQLIADGGFFVGGIYFSIAPENIPDELLEALNETSHPESPLLLEILEG